MKTDNIIFELCRKVGVSVSENDIGHPHVVGEPRNGKCQIIARFLSYRVRQRVYENRFNLANDSLRRYINEDLTRKRYGIVRHLAKLRGAQKIH